MRIDIDVLRIGRLLGVINLGLGRRLLASGRRQHRCALHCQKRHRGRDRSGGFTYGTVNEPRYGW
jgi:hypothetical protein